MPENTDVRRILDSAADSVASMPEWMRTNFGKETESRDRLQRVVRTHLREARKAAKKLDLDTVVADIDRALKEV